MKTYLNSGNVIFSSEKEDIDNIANQIEAMIQNVFYLNIPVFVVKQKRLVDILNHSPKWWGNDNKEIYHNLIFIFPSVQFSEVYDKIGEPKENLERIENYKEVIFWSFSRKDYQKTNWWSKTANSDISDKLTIRTANTVRKISYM